MSWIGDRLSGWCAFISGGSNKKKTQNQESFQYQSGLWRPALAFELEFSTFLCPSVFKEQFPTHLESFRWIRVTSKEV